MLDEPLHWGGLFVCLPKRYAEWALTNDYRKYLTQKNFYLNPNRISLKMFSHQKFEKFQELLRRKKILEARPCKKN